MRTMPRAEIRLLKGHEEFRRCEHIQKAVWGTLGVASEVLSVTQKYGGVVLGAIVGGEIVGFIYAFLGRRNGQWVHWSHQMAVLEKFRDLGLGFRMKLAHRKIALQRGIKSICWTFDPLQSRNASLNLHRLGTRAEEYLPDCYGSFPSRIERGLASDRFVVNWRIASAGVARRLTAGPPAWHRLPGPCVNETRRNAQGFVENFRISLNLADPRLLVQISAHTDAMRARALPLARRWRMETRKIFLRYFSAGYRATDFIPPCAATQGRCFYILTRP